MRVAQVLIDRRDDHPLPVMKDTRTLGFYSLIIFY